jgi:uncharacterized membrane protein
MSRLDPFWEVMCQYKDFIWLGVMVVLFLAVLTVMSLLLAPPGSASSIVAYMNLFLVVVLGLLLGGMYRKCATREAEGY